MRVGVAVGQFLDLAGSGRPVSEADARRISRLKSGGYTVEGPVEVGAILAGAGPDVLSALSRYGAALGEAFQLRDDVEGFVDGEPDLRQGRPTVLLARARALVEERDRALLERLGSGDLTDEKSDRAADLVRSCGAVEWARARIRELADSASVALGHGSLDGDSVTGLRALASVIAEG
jgi:geranylgeranyl diphosphate synthase type I